MKNIKYALVIKNINNVNVRGILSNSEIIHIPGRFISMLTKSSLSKKIFTAGSLNLIARWAIEYVIIAEDKIKPIITDRFDWEIDKELIFPIFTKVKIAIIVAIDAIAGFPNSILIILLNVPAVG